MTAHDEGSGVRKGWTSAVDLGGGHIWHSAAPERVPPRIVPERRADGQYEITLPLGARAADAAVGMMQVPRDHVLVDHLTDPDETSISLVFGEDTE